jgi:hypothetical protein
LHLRAVALGQRHAGSLRLLLHREVVLAGKGWGASQVIVTIGFGRLNLLAHLHKFICSGDDRLGFDRNVRATPWASKEEGC